MPRTIEHILATHQLAQQRREAGQPIWDRTINLGDVFHNEAMTFEERRDAIVRKLSGSSWLAGRDEHDHLVEIIANLAEARDTAEFDEWWDQLYDEADYDRVWISTT